jgi:hypothetical protein
VAVVRGRLLWRIGEVVETAVRTPRTKSLFIEVPGWEGHKAGQHVDVRLTASAGRAVSPFGRRRSPCGSHLPR